ncbi:MAG: hypothetical protein KAR87_01030 [Candidatus Aenigmarchaeota archaeon]|nr:hypothetical protein [Candidatus Aenigmarchaeota archaeon]
MVAKKTKKAVKKTDKAKVTKKTTNKAVKKEEINSTEKTSQKSSGKKCSSDSSNTGNMCKTEAIYLAAGVVIGILIMFAYTQINPTPVDSPSNNYLSLSEAEAVVLDVVKMDPNLEMLNVTPSIINSSESNGMYSVNVKLSGPQGDTTFNSYITKDGKVLFPKGINVEEYKQLIEQVKEEELKEAVEDNTDDSSNEITGNVIKQSTNPQLEAYVVSRCPFGVQMQRIMAEIIKEIPEAADSMNVRYMGAVVDDKITAMHGDVEAQENLRQICLREEQADKYWLYVSCYMKEGKTDECLTSTNVDADKLNTCMTDTSKGLVYAQVDFDLNEKYGVTGSPTLIMNDERVSEFDFGGRTAEAVKSVLCEGFTTKPNYCSTTLTEESAAASLSPTYSGASSSGSC